MEKFSHYLKRNFRIGAVLNALIVFLFFAEIPFAIGQTPCYYKGDFHQHTTFTDGSWSYSWVTKQDSVFGLHWWTNSEHGGGFTKNAHYSGKDIGSDVYWDSYIPNIIKGRYATSGGHQVMWRWQSLMDSSFYLTQQARNKYPQKTIIQGYEWNVPGHEHASLAIINNQFNPSPNCLPLSEFEFKFDNSDQDTTGGATMGWTKSTAAYGQHAKMTEALHWLSQNYPYTSWAIPAHPERKSLNTIGTFREMNDIAPTVCYGFESMPGHQRSTNRGEYSKANNSVGKSTYGGAGAYSAKVGGLWDAMLSEGRNWWLFASSDFHDTIADFYPGEYQKTYTFCANKTAQGIVDGLRSGNNWIVNGDLIDSLNFFIIQQNNPAELASMGQSLFIAKDSAMTIRIIVRDPSGNNHNRWSAYNNPQLDHIDIIEGQLRDKLPYSSDPNSDYQKKDTVATTQVIARFDATGGYVDGQGVVSQAWTDMGGGIKSMEFTLPASRDYYFRLRGTNIAVNTTNQIDANGNPLSDTLMGSNSAVKAFDDLWFYSNPIFVKTKAINTESIDISISQASDDLEEYLPAGPGQSLTHDVGEVDTGSSDLELGSVTTGTEDPQLVGMRFQNVKIPKNAIITNAYIEFEVDKNDKNASPCELYIYSENNVNPQTFAYNNFELTSRPKNTDSIYWYIDAGDGEVIDSKIQTSNISSLVQTLVNRSGWNRGNAMAFYIKGSGTREFESFDGEASAAAKLHVEFLTLKTQRIPIVSGSDDVEEWIAPKSGQTQANPIGVIDSLSSDLELGCESGLNKDPQMIGLRFAGISVPKNIFITNAYIEFEVDAISKNSNPTILSIQTEDSDNPSTFSYAAYSVSSRPKAAPFVNWTIPTASFNVIDSKGQTTNIADLVNHNLNRNGWVSGNAMAFFISGQGLREVESYEGEKNAAATLVMEYYDKYNRFDSILDAAAILIDTNYTVPSWTRFLQVYKKANYYRDSVTVTQLQVAMDSLKHKNTPYNVVMNINGDPTTRMGFAWYNNAGVTGGCVEIVQGVVSNHAGFSTPAFSVNANSTAVNNTNYCVSANDLFYLANIANNTKRSYVSNKAVVANLLPNTTYSFRVGKPGYWSQIGTFTTANNNKDEFSFIYFTDPQANTNEMFDISQKTTHAAKSMYPNTNFWLSAGDLIETNGSNNSEWEYEQFFETQQDIWYHSPFAPVMGNHDKSVNKNFTRHFNTPVTPFDSIKSTTPGSIYSFVYGDALFMAMSFEDYSVAGVLDSVANWMKATVAANEDVRWRIAFYHKPLYTGSGSHQSDADGKIVRDKFAPLFDTLNINWAIHGHDHIYEVIGPVNNKQKVANSVSNQTIVPRIPRENMTGKLGGTFDTQGGTLYFLNNSAGKKKYEPRDSATMKANEGLLGIVDYFTLFTGRFGQTGEPTFSYVTVSTDTIHVLTYTVDDNGNPTLFDQYKIVDSYKIPTTLTWNTPADIEYGTALDTVQLNAAANILGTYTYNPSAGTILNAGNQQMLVVCFTPNSSNYTSICDTVYLDVSPTTSNINWSNPADIVYGTALDGIQLNASSATSGTFAYNPATGIILNAGNAQRLITTFTSSDPNYTNASDTVYINVLKAIPAITWNNPTDITYGTPLSATQLNAMANTPGSFAYNPISGTILHVGMAQLLTTHFTPTSTNYSEWNDSAYINVLSTTGVSNVENSGLYVYPNPFENTLYISSSKTCRMASISDILGKEFMKIQGDFYNKMISTENLPSGIYVLKIEYSDSNISCIRIVKQ